MNYDSVILSLAFTLLQRLKEAYYGSATASIIRRFAEWVKKLVSYSSIWCFIKRESFFSKVWEHSGVFSLFNWILNLPSQLCRRGYYKFEEVFSNSSAFRLLKLGLRRFELLIAAALLVIIVVPHDYWNNIYSTAIVFLLVFLYFLKTVMQKYESFNLKAVDFVLFVFMTSIVLASVTSIFPKQSFKFLLFYATCFLLLIVIVSSIKSGRTLGIMIEIMLIGVAISGLYGIYQGIVGVPFNPAYTDVELNQGMAGRIYSTMANPNNYAELLILTLPFFFAVIFNSKTIFKKVLYILLGIPPLVALFLTGSRSGWVALVIGFFVYVFLKNRKYIPIFIILWDFMYTTAS